MLVLDYDQLVGIARKYDQQSTLVSVGEPRTDEGQELSDWEVTKAGEEAMGPNLTSLVAVRGMKNYASLRIRLLRLAQQLALMPNSERATILKEHGLGTDVPLKDLGQPVSSFAAQLRFESLSEVGLLVARLCDATRSHRSMCEGGLNKLFWSLALQKDDSSITTLFRNKKPLPTFAITCIKTKSRSIQDESSFWKSIEVHRFNLSLPNCI